MSLKPVLSDLFECPPKLSYKIFIGDSAFDSYDIYTMLKSTFHFTRACIPMDSRNAPNLILHLTRMKANIYLAGIVQLADVLLADTLHKPELVKSVQKLITTYPVLTWRLFLTKPAMSAPFVFPFLMLGTVFFYKS